MKRGTLVVLALASACKQPAAAIDPLTGPDASHIDASIADATVGPPFALSVDGAVAPFIDLRRQGPRDHFVRYGVALDTAGNALLNGDSTPGTNFRGCGTRSVGPDVMAELLAVLRANDVMSLHTGESIAAIDAIPHRHRYGDDGSTWITVTLDGQTKRIGYFGSLADGTAEVGAGEEDRLRAVSDAITSLTGVDPWNPDTPYTPCEGFANDRGQWKPETPPLLVSLDVWDPKKATEASAQIFENGDHNGGLNLGLSTGRSSSAPPRCMSASLSKPVIAKVEALLTPTALATMKQKVPAPAGVTNGASIHLRVEMGDTVTSIENLAGPGNDPKLDALVSRLEAMTPLGGWIQKGQALPICIPHGR